MSPRTDLSPRDRILIKREVSRALHGYEQVYAWSGEGFKEHWADSIALGIATAREGIIDTEWLHEVRLAVYRELKLNVVDVATPVRS